MMLRGGELPTGAVVVKANWSDNPLLPEVLNQERLDCLKQNPEQYGHTWEGEYATVNVGAYYARDIAEARKQNRIGKVQPDPLMKTHLFCDIGGTGANADAFAIWAAQIIGREIRVLNYYESVGQPLAAHLVWMREHGYVPGKVQIWLPHDGAAHDKVYSVSYESALKQVGYDVEVVTNQGRGAEKARIEAARRYFASCWFDAEKTQPGMDALGWYHEKKDEARNIGLGPEHDWASHGADAFGLMAVVVESLFDKPKNRKAADVPRISGWMN
jgi:phage terminase large subunit